MFSIMLFGWLLRASILLTIGWLVTRWIETRSASAAHRVLVIAFVGCLLLPFAMALSPTWKWQSPSWLSTSSSSLQSVEVAKSDIKAAMNNQLAGRSGFPVSSMQSDSQLGKPAQPNSSTKADGNDSAELDISPRETHASLNELESWLLITNSDSNLKWGWWLVLAWLTCSTAFVLRLLFSLVFLRRHVAGCVEASQAVSKHANDFAVQLGFEQSARIRLTLRDSMPMSCWLGRPVIVLPCNFDEWPEEHRNAALSHEFGHLVRRDAWADYLVQFVLCILWVNPLAWWAAADVRRLRERACDEWVLKRSGVSPASYANCLLAVVKCCHDQRLKFASPMASRRDLEARLSWLMSASDRPVIRPLVEFAVSCFVVMVGVAVATGHPTSASVGSETERPEVILSQDPSPATPAISVAGIVADETGKPLAGMNVVLRGQVRLTHQYCNGLGHFRDFLASTSTNADGQFRFSNVGIPPRMIEVLSKLRAGEEGAQLLVWGPGKAIVWEPVSSFKDELIRIQLADETEFKGTILGPGGKPLDGATLRVSGFSKGTNDLSAFLNDPGDLNINSSELKIETTTRKGQFSLPNMPANVRAMVRCTGQKGERESMLIDTGGGAFNTVELRGGGTREMNVLRSPARVVLKQEPWVEIRIVDHAGKPVSGGGLEAITNTRHYGGSVSVGNDGSAKLIVTDAGLHKVVYVADPLSPAIGVSKQVDIQTTGSQVEFKLPKPVFIEGEVVDSETGIPIIGAYVGWRNRKRVPNSPEQQNTGAIGVTGKNGKFRLPITAGEQRLFLRHEIDGYIIGGSPKGTAVSVSTGGVANEIVIQVGQGLTIQGIVTDDNGQPASGAKVTVAETERNFREASTVTDGQGRYKIASLSPTLNMRVSTWSDAGVAHDFLNGDPDHLMEKNLEKTVNLKIKGGTTLTGRVVQAGKPVAGVTVKLKSAPSQPPEQNWTRYYFLSESITDSEGKYRVTGLHKGEQYAIEVSPVGNAEIRDWEYSSSFVHEMKEEDGSTIELPDAVLSTNSQSLSGIVVDPEGNPVAGYTVSASLVSSVNGMSLSRPSNGPPPWTKSDKKGQFQLTYLPDEPLKLMTYKANPKGGPIHYSTNQEVKLNDKQIRIVIDPKLGSGMEDSDQ